VRGVDASDDDWLRRPGESVEAHRRRLDALEAAQRPIWQAQRLRLEGEPDE
jgi:hypothetical protein